MALQNLPIGIQSFENLRSNNYLYVDKTEIIYNMALQSYPYFLSRPRRFGKSLLVSTLDCLFSGKKELFERLWIYDKWDWTKTYPVVRFDFGSQNYQNAEKLEQDLIAKVDEYAIEFGVELNRTWSARFAELIERVHAKTGEKVVILVDEYDKAIIDNLKDIDLANEIRVSLHNFYQILKATSDHLRFVFLTGVSKFSKVSIFSGLNNLKDLTLDDKFSTICGITQTELETRFAPYIDEMAEYHKVTEEQVLEQIKKWYDGFSWDAVNYVYNPFSTLLLFDRQKFIDYWFESGSPSFLIDLIKKRNDIDTVLKPFEVAENALDAFDLNNLNTTTLLFQTGYLTVKDIRTKSFGEGSILTLTVPNNEVRNGLALHLLSAFANSNITDVSIESNKMMKQLLEGNSEAFNTSLKRLLSRIPYQLHIPNEAYYHSLFLTWLNFMGFTPEAEVSTNIGRMDAVWEWNERVVIAECKYSATETAENLIEQAFAQIKARKYAERYEGDNKRIALLAIVFAGKEVESRMMELGEIE
jgi:hypothetical protein